MLETSHHSITDQHDKPYLATSYYAVNDPAAKLAVANSLADIFPFSPFFKNCLKLLLATAYIMFLIILCYNYENIVGRLVEPFLDMYQSESVVRRRVTYYRLVQEEVFS